MYLGGELYVLHSLGKNAWTIFYYKYTAINNGRIFTLKNAVILALLESPNDQNISSVQ